MQACGARPCHPAETALWTSLLLPQAPDVRVDRPCTGIGGRVNRNHGDSAARARIRCPGPDSVSWPGLELLLPAVVASIHPHRSTHESTHRDRSTTRRRACRHGGASRWAASARDRSRLEMACPTGIDLRPAEACLLTTRIRILLLPMVQAAVRCACGADEPGTRNQPKMSSTHPVGPIEASPSGLESAEIGARVT